MARLPEAGLPTAGSSPASLPAPLTIGVVGAGRAGGTMARSLARVGHVVLVARRGAPAAELAADLGSRLATDRELLATADVTILAVPDAAIAGVVEALAPTALPGDGRVVAHLSGSQGRDILAPLAARGYATAAAHPLQVLSGWRIAPGTAFAIDSDPEAEAVLSGLVAQLGGVQLPLPGGARGAYHAAAVLAANLGMTMLAEAVDVLEGLGMPRAEALQGLGSLVRGGLEASMDRGLPAALTGPVTRGDLATVRAHLEALAPDPDLRRAYAAASLLTLRQAARDGRPGRVAAEKMRALLEAAR